ncbi:hypothetical protein [Aeromonas hydrophila]|uniref:hypothetical protein n=1 Tax=Aeromonas hydrophila TaxID=644 RepID=UPI000AE0C835|nr:hypothetical protein [Aeromonas hydrophila]HAT1542659.1 hypothetical protein [Aeromonas hydrophila]HAT1555110.1 hypothetical protein [Aeromonas hydrophila]
MVLDEEKLARIGSNVRRLNNFHAQVQRRQTLSKDDLLRALEIMDEIHASLLGDRYMAEKLKKD